MTEKHHKTNFSDALNNLVNAVTANANTTQELMATNKILTENLKVALEKNKVLTHLLQ